VTPRTGIAPGQNLLTTPGAQTLLLGLLLALVGMNLSTVVPEWGIDSSFRVLLTEATLDGRQFGVDLIWPYGSLGFLAGPTLISRGLLALAIVYQLLVLVVLFTALVVHLVDLGVARWRAVMALLPVALAISITDNIVPEVVAVAIIVALLVLRERGHFEQWPRTWPALATAGVFAGSLILVKFGPGGLACAIVSLLALMSKHRLRAVPVALAAIGFGFLGTWLVTGQRLSGLLPYFLTELEVVGGYQQAQAYGPDGKKVAVIGALTLLVLAAGAVVAYQWMRVERKAWQVLFLLALAIWFVAKQSFIRWDPWHAVGGLLLISLLVATLRWQNRWHLVLLGVLLGGGLVSIAAEPSRLRSTLGYRLDAVLAVLSGDYQATHLANARSKLVADYAVPADVVAALAGGTVHAEPWDINALWANDLKRKVLATPQSYATYTAELDRINAAQYASDQGPDGVLFSPESTVDTRYGPWESPDARVALTCHFAQVAASGTWQALRRAPNACGVARPLGTEGVAPGSSIRIPEASNPDSLVIARFELPGDPLGHLTAAIARPMRYAYVNIDGTRHRLVTGTAPGAHLLRSPGKIGTRELPHGALAHSTLSFENLGNGEVKVRFEEIPLLAH
jgi:hypothetical protein